MRLHEMSESDRAAEVERWRGVFARFAGRMRPNKRPAAETICYLSQKYSISELFTKELLAVAVGNVAFLIEQGLYPSVSEPLCSRAFALGREGGGEALYALRDAVFESVPIYIYIEEKTGNAAVEGSFELMDEVTAFVGLDESELKNPYLVANYIDCLKKHPSLADEDERFLLDPAE